MNFCVLQKCFVDYMLDYFVFKGTLCGLMYLKDVMLVFWMFCGQHLGLHYSLKVPCTFVHDLGLCISCWTIFEVL
jgi:hypothetical protein